MQPPHPAGRADAAGERPLRQPNETSSADQQALAGAKALLRDAVRRRRAARPDAQRAADDHARTLRTLDFLGDADALRVAVYVSVREEPSTLELIGALTAMGARVLLPVLGPEPDWAWYAGPDALRAGWNDIPEPTGERLGAAALAKADVVVCTGLAATVRGDRLGVGGGWYDRARAAAPDVPTVVLLNDDEVLDVLPTEPHDLPVDAIITPTRTLGCAPDA